MSRRTAIRRAAIAILAILSVSATAVEITRGDRPARAQRTPADACLKFSDPKISVARFIINFCRKTVYVSVIEFSTETMSKYCAVYGLLGNRYGKQYGPGEYFERNSMKVSYNAERALEECTYSGYETSGDGIGQFMRIIDE